MAITKEDVKAQREREIFIEFVKAANLNIEPDSVISEVPPKPDISCELNRARCYFEMAEITDEDLARSRGIHKHDDEIYGGAISHSKPLEDVINTKASKQYDADGPLELLIYYDKQVPPYFDDKFISANIGSKVDSMIASGRWAGVWAFDRWKKRILWNSADRGEPLTNNPVSSALRAEIEEWQALSAEGLKRFPY